MSVISAGLFSLICLSLVTWVVASMALRREDEARARAARLEILEIKERIAALEAAAEEES